MESAQLADVVAEECRTMPEFHISEKALLEAKIYKLDTSIHNAEAEVARV